MVTPVHTAAIRIRHPNTATIRIRHPNTAAIRIRIRTQPPELDEMTELNDGISVTGQRISRDNGKSLYFYVDLQDELAELRVKTWGGPGDCELHIALGALPYTDDWGWIEDDWY